MDTHVEVKLTAREIELGYDAIARRAARMLRARVSEADAMKVVARMRELADARSRYEAALYEAADKLIEQ